MPKVTAIERVGSLTYAQTEGDARYRPCAAGFSPAVGGVCVAVGGVLLPRPGPRVSDRPVLVVAGLAGDITYAGGVRRRVPDGSVALGTGRWAVVVALAPGFCPAVGDGATVVDGQAHPATLP